MKFNAGFALYTLLIALGAIGILAALITLCEGDYGRAAFLGVVSAIMFAVSAGFSGNEVE